MILKDKCKGCRFEEEQKEREDSFLKHFMSKANMEAKEWMIRSGVGLCVGMLEGKHCI